MGGVIQDGQKVKNIKPGQVVTVTTTSDIYEGKNIVITAGPWAQNVLSPIGLELPLKVRVNICEGKIREITENTR